MNLNTSKKKCEKIKCPIKETEEINGKAKCKASKKNSVLNVRENRVNRISNCIKNGLASICVKEKRILVSDFLIACFYYDKMNRGKVHKIWTKEPTGWDKARAEFVNPNVGHGKRAKMEDLDCMLLYLIDIYKRKFLQKSTEVIFLVFTVI